MKYDPPEEAAINVTKDGKVNVLYSANYHGGNDYHWQNGGDLQNAGGLYCYDTNATRFTINSGQGGNFYKFELFYHARQLQQFKNFRLTRGGTDNRIHIAYYDTLAGAVKYSSVVQGTAFTNKSNHEIQWCNIDGGNDITTYNVSISPVGAKYKLVASNFEDGLGPTSGTAEYCAIALDGSGMPVVVYADVDTGTLRLARATSANPTNASAWKVQPVLGTDDPNAGMASEYFAAKFDSKGYLHIAFKNTRGELCYVKSTNANTNGGAYTFGESVIVDSTANKVELTLDGDVPYIAYISRSGAYDGIHIAYFDGELAKSWNADGTKNEKGAWNVMTVALQNRASEARACIEVAPQGTSARSDWKAAVGYTTGREYRVVKYIGE